MDGHVRFDDALDLLPPGWRTRLAGRTAEPAAGMGGASVFRVFDMAGSCSYLKLACGPEAEPLRQEIVRTEWLASHRIRVPQFLMKTSTDMVTAVLMTALPGSHLAPGAGQAKRQPLGQNVPAAVRAVGRGLARLHALPAADCPFDEMSRTRLMRARHDIDRHLIDGSHFDDRNAGVTPDALWRCLAETVPIPEDLVVVHGDATLENMLIGADGELGFIDCGHAGRSDRYVDLAVIEEGLREEFGRKAAAEFKTAYGIREWNERKAAYFRDLYELF
jgi:aminoglycoside phosphotransferase